MSLRSIVSCCAISVLIAAACSKKSDHPVPGDSNAAPGEATQLHASADAVPGSHEDWCGEHAVPESQCTLCNPSLAAAFKATGDWCADHGLPKSHCRKCDPALSIVRPPKQNPAR